MIKKVTFELSEKCNAACPLCMRTNRYNFSLPTEHVSRKRELLVNDFKHIMNEDVLYTIDEVSLCGNVGDPIAAKDCLPIVKYLSNYPVTILLETNGSLRNEKWWSEMGSCMNSNSSTVFFHIDGLEDTNHLYRQKTDFNKIINNAKSFIQSGGNAVWEFIPFKHNEHQVEEARELSRKMGFKRFASKETVRQYLPDVPLENQGHYDLAGNLYKKSSKHEEKRTIYSLPESKRYQPEMLRYGYKESPIVCRSEDKKQMFLTSDERIIPCCHVQEFFTIKDYHPERINQEPKYQGYEIDGFYKQFGVLSDLNKNTFDEIVDSYMEAYPYLEYMWQERKMARCNKKCGSNFRNVSRYQEN